MLRCVSKSGSYLNSVQFSKITLNQSTPTLVLTSRRSVRNRLVTVLELTDKKPMRFTHQLTNHCFGESVYHLSLTKAYDVKLMSIEASRRSAVNREAIRATYMAVSASYFAWEQPFLNLQGKRSFTKILQDPVRNHARS